MTANIVWTIKNLLEWAISFFKNKEILNPRLSAEILLSFVLDLSRMQLYLKHDYVLNEQELKRYKELILRRLEHEPIQYITGTAYFRKLSLEVKRGILIPRPETEILVDCAKEAIDKLTVFNEKKNNKDEGNSNINILEIGTGSGAISISLLHEHSEEKSGFFDLDIIATDISTDAIEITKRNTLKEIKSENKASHLSLFKCDIIPDDDLDFQKKYLGRIDLIISNPPYISDESYRGLGAEIKDYEPETALRAGKTGLEVYEKILNKTMPYISKSKAIIILEIDPCLKEGLSTLAADAYKGKEIKILFNKDYNNFERVCIIEI